MLFFLNAAIWLAIGISSLLRITDRGPVNPVMLLMITVLMFGNVAAMILGGMCVSRQGRRYYYFALAVLVVNIILTVTNEFGILDLVTLVIDLVLWGLVIAARSGMSPKTQRTKVG